MTKLAALRTNPQHTENALFSLFVHFKSNKLGILGHDMWKRMSLNMRLYECVCTSGGDYVQVRFASSPPWRRCCW